MDDLTMIDLAKATLLTSLMLVAPVLLVAMFVGIVVSLFQTMTSMQEQTLALVPKMLAVVATLLLLMPWILGTLRDFARGLIGQLAAFGPPGA